MILLNIIKKFLSNKNDVSRIISFYNYVVISRTSLDLPAYPYCDVIPNSSFSGIFDKILESKSLFELNFAFI